MDLNDKYPTQLSLREGWLLSSLSYISYLYMIIRPYLLSTVTNLSSSFLLWRDLSQSFKYIRNNSFIWRTLQNIYILQQYSYTIFLFSFLHLASRFFYFLSGSLFLIRQLRKVYLFICFSEDNFMVEVSNSYVIYFFFSAIIYSLILLFSLCSAVLCGAVRRQLISFLTCIDTYFIYYTWYGNTYFIY